MQVVGLGVGEKPAAAVALEVAAAATATDRRSERRLQTAKGVDNSNNQTRTRLCSVQITFIEYGTELHRAPKLSRKHQRTLARRKQTSINTA